MSPWLDVLNLKRLKPEMLLDLEIFSYYGIFAHTHEDTLGRDLPMQNQLLPQRQ